MTQQTKQEEITPFQAGVNDYLRFDCERIPEQQGTILFQAGIGVKLGTAMPQATARKEFAKLPIGRQHRGTASIEYNNQSDPGGSG